jgi:hypothetical protein
LNVAQEQFGEVIDLDQHPGPISWYWTLSPDDAFAVSARRPGRHLTMGDLDDDLLETAELLRGEDDRGVILWHDLAHLCGLLGALTYLDLHHTTGGP